jgi:hypothetical protein
MDDWQVPAPPPDKGEPPWRNSRDAPGGGSGRRYYPPQESGSGFDTGAFVKNGCGCILLILGVMFVLSLVFGAHFYISVG